MGEKTKKDIEATADHTAHGVEDIADIIGHGLGGAVEGLADGVESAKAETKVRESDDG